jgi:myosin heavy subunit
MAEEVQKEKPRRDKLIIFLLIVMTVACAAFAWMYWSQKQEKENLITENIQITEQSEEVKRDLNQLQTEYDALKTDDEELKKEIDDKKAEIEKLQAEAEKHKNDAYIISKLKKETKTLRDIMKHFVVEIDSLNTLNKTLTAERDSANIHLKTEKEKSTTLQTEKEKLYKMGSALKAGNISVKAYNVRGKDRQSETTKARKTDKIQIAFTIAENKIAPSGNKTIYLRLVTPDGKEWTEAADADHMFTFNGSKGFYAVKKLVQYDNNDTEVVMSVKKKETEDFLPGKYMLELSTDNSSIGSTSLELE